VTAQAQGRQAQLSQLELAQARLQVLSNLIQRGVLFQRAESEQLLPTPDEIEGAINTQKQQSGMTQEEFEKSLKQQNVSIETLREESRKDLAITKLQDKYSGKISISDKEVEDFYNGNRQQFVNARGVALAMIMVDPADNSAQGIANDAKNEAEAKLKIDNIYQQLQGKADFAGGTRNPAAYEAYLKGMEIYNRRNTPDEFAQAVRFFQQALELDPNFGAAAASLAWAYWEMDGPRVEIPCLIRTENRLRAR
jgi:tetratricopeptide (TPR) repeat protein